MLAGHRARCRNCSGQGTIPWGAAMCSQPSKVTTGQPGFCKRTASQIHCGETPSSRAWRKTDVLVKQSAKVGGAVHETKHFACLAMGTQCPFRLHAESNSRISPRKMRSADVEPIQGTDTATDDTKGQRSLRFLEMIPKR